MLVVLPCGSWWYAGHTACSRARVCVCEKEKGRERERECCPLIFCPNLPLARPTRKPVSWQRCLGSPVTWESGSMVNRQVIAPLIGKWIAKGRGLEGLGWWSWEEKGVHRDIGLSWNPGQGTAWSVHRTPVSCQFLVWVRHPEELNSKQAPPVRAFMCLVEELALCPVDFGKHQSVFSRKVSRPFLCYKLCRLREWFWRSQNVPVSLPLVLSFSNSFKQETVGNCKLKNDKKNGRIKFYLMGCLNVQARERGWGSRKAQE